MPIRDVTDLRRLPRIDKIHLGIKVAGQNGAEYPKATDYFVCPEEVREVYGEQPKELSVIFPSDDMDVIASAWYRAYAGSRGLTCKGDGDRANRMIDANRIFDASHQGGEIPPIADGRTTNVKWVYIDCPGKECEYYLKKACRQLMMLQFVVQGVPGLGVYQLGTSSFHSIVQVYNSLELVRAAVGSIAGVPLTLTLEPRDVSPDGKKKTVYVLHIRTEKTYEELQSAQIQINNALSSPADDTETPEEFFPPGNVDTNTGEVMEDAPSERPAQAATNFRHVGDLFNHGLQYGVKPDWIVSVAQAMGLDVWKPEDLGNHLDNAELLAHIEAGVIPEATGTPAPTDDLDEAAQREQDEMRFEPDPPEPEPQSLTETDDQAATELKPWPRSVLGWRQFLQFAKDERGFRADDLLKIAQGAGILGADAGSMDVKSLVNREDFHEAIDAAVTA